MAETKKDNSISTVKKTSDKKKMNNDLKQFDADIFDILDDDKDALEYTTEALNQYFSTGQPYSIINEEEMIENDSHNDNNDIESMEEEEEQEQEQAEEDQEEILSQKLSQLSTKSDDDERKSSVTNKRRRSSTISSPSVISKIKMTDDNDLDDNDTEQDQIPTYLLQTDMSFDHMIQKIVNTDSSINMNDLRQVAILIHQIAALRIQKEISTIYLQSGTATLKEPEPELIQLDRRVQPMQVKSVMLARRTKTTTATTMEMNKEDEHLNYENRVHQRLQEMNTKIQKYQRQLDEKKSHLINFTSTIEEAIHIYIHQHGIKSLEMKRDLKIALLKYDYDAEILERKYLRENPNEYQIQSAKRLYEVRNEAEKSRRALIELKQRVFFNKPPVSYNSIQISMPTSIDTATTTTTTMNDNIHQRLFDKHEKMIQRKKIDYMAIHIARAETKYYQDQKIFNFEWTRMQENHRNLVKNQGMPTTLSNLIEKRLTNITDRWRDIHNYTIKYYLQTSYGDVKYAKKNGKKQTIKLVGFSPRLIIDTTTHSFTDKQIQLLNQGPTYVPPCQIHISSSCQSTEDIIKKTICAIKTSNS